MMDNNKTFSYTYSASQQEEIKKIRDKYTAPTQTEDKMEQLRRLDKSVTKPGTVVSLIIGVISALILGIGMCCTMVWGGDLFIIGIIIGVFGMIGVICAYPVYASITKARREKLAAEIIRLSNELMK
ncbi:MAG: hypothetical protein K2J80_02155 [Oscillospiraceae bacterium]|nr:hypothetical protein [Oscillospiraceae bacterium]